jgi:hypothetical protein
MKTEFIKKLPQRKEDSDFKFLLIEDKFIATFVKTHFLEEIRWRLIFLGSDYTQKVKKNMTEKEANRLFFEAFNTSDFKVKIFKNIFSGKYKYKKVKTNGREYIG